jgi:uncharacterized delta-60 repeat protein
MRALNFPYLHLFIAVVCFLHCRINSFGQAGNIDTAFGESGFAETVLGNSSEINAIAIQPDGKIVAGGFTHYEVGQFSYAFVLAQYNSDGTLDQTFGMDGIGDYPPIYTAPTFGKTLCLQADGKILQGGYGVSGTYIVRYNTNGFVDATFGDAGAIVDLYGDYAGAWGMALDQYQRIVVIGSSFIMGRYHSDGSIDTTFGNDGVFMGFENSYALAIAVQSDGKILGVGETDGFFSVVRFNEDASLDQSFGQNGIVKVPDAGMANSIALQQDSKILVAGSGFEVLRFNTDGSLDSLFGINGIASFEFAPYWSYVNSVAVQPDGKIVLAGSCGSDIAFNNNIAVARTNPDGSPDSTFGTDGKIISDVHGSEDQGNSIAMAPDGKIVVGGYSSNSTTTDHRFCLVEYLSDLNVGELSFHEENSLVRIYPNPLHANEILTYELKELQSVSIRLLDINGKLIKTFVANEVRVAGQHSEQLVFPLLESGNYLLVISNAAGERFTLKLVK